MSRKGFEQALDEAEEIELTVTGRVSGKPSTRPVWFVRDRDRVYLLPVQGTDTEWFKNVRANPTVRLRIDGEEITARAKPITDREKVAEVVEKFRDKYGARDVRRYYSKFDAAVEVPLGPPAPGARSARGSVREV
ncbi:MAG TPA: nitroreductase/quinone reductase family protein [Candidatus Dormibacteraeota bacterium]|jgi:deazaflavin-dependent oxidoreductase (nitroreductase family)|nr:nitroreductase/quinone reductase family protein [Candidatus Dormibacteraeota bacterium]